MVDDGVNGLMYRYEDHIPWLSKLSGYLLMMILQLCYPLMTKNSSKKT
jgi:hypothetical protein